MLPDALVLATCLREVRICMRPAREHTSDREADAAGFERHVGAEAYRFLLQLACGLESEIAGETEILGQIKQAWRDYEAVFVDQLRQFAAQGLTHGVFGDIDLQPHRD